MIITWNNVELLVKAKFKKKVCAAKFGVSRLKLGPKLQFLPFSEV